MNKEYIYKDGKIVVIDELGKLKNIDYSDNFNEILIKENLIEQMELEHEKLIKEKKHNKNISFKLLTKSVFCLLTIPVVLILLPLITGVVEFVSLPIIGCIGATGIPVFLTIFLIYEYNKTDNINKGIENQIKFLESKLNIERENLTKLKREKTKEDKIILVPVSKRVDDIQELKRLREQLIVYYNCGYYQARYQKYFKKRNSRKKLLKYYNEEQIKLAEEYLSNQNKQKKLTTKAF